MATITHVASAVPGVFPFSMQAKQSIVVDPKSPGGVDSPHGLILFDGVCVLCSRGCGFVSKRDRRGYFRFVPMQMAEGRRLAERPAANSPSRPPAANPSASTTALTAPALVPVMPSKCRASSSSRRSSMRAD